MDLYIYSTNVSTEYFKHGIYFPFFPLQNAVCFIILTYFVPVLFTFLYTGCAKIKKKIRRQKVIEMKQKKEQLVGSHYAIISWCTVHRMWNEKSPNVISYFLHPRVGCVEGLLYHLDHTQWHIQTRLDSSGRGIGPSQKPLYLYDTPRSRQTSIPPGGICARYSNKRSASELRLSWRGHRDGQYGKERTDNNLRL